MIMIAGNVAEFWFFTDLPYGALNARSWAWIAVLLGCLGLLASLALLGLAARRQHTLPVWASVLFGLCLPAWLALFFTLIEFNWVILFVVGVAASGLALAPGSALRTGPAEAHGRLA
jgi:hypothetical protein